MALAAAQSPPPHPRLLVTPSTLPAIQAKVLASGTQSNAAFNACSTSAPLQTVGPSSITNQGNYVVMRSLRRMLEVAFRYQITGNATYGNTAKGTLLSVCNYLIPYSSAYGQDTGPVYQGATYAACIGMTYDMVFPLLSTSERATVVSHLEAWVTAMLNASAGVFSYASYSGACDNGSYSWSQGIAIALLAIWGDSSYPNLLNHVYTALGKINDGWQDAVSPDGSIDESYGYANYGVMSSLNAAIAAMNCGLGDYVAGTNILKSPRWLAASLMGSSFTWIGDSSPNHKGLRLDPILYYVVNRTQDPVGLWALQSIQAIEPLGDGTVSMAYSPFVTKALHYPDGLAAQAPAMPSAFFRDNLNEGTPNGNKYGNFHQVGTGGQAFLHNSSDPSDKQLAALYLIRDEWMNHNHEDDGNFTLASEGQHFYLDTGYTGQSAAQSTAHNLVMVSGSAGFGGSGTNYFSPPSPNGRYLGSVEALSLGSGFDYVRGDHSNMWMMQKADRTVVMIKDPTTPYVLLVSNVKQDSSSHTYEEVFHGASSATGAGTAASPMTTTRSGKYLRAVYLSPASVSVVAGSGSSGGGQTWYRNKVTASGVDVSFVSAHGAIAPNSTATLSSPLSNTSGGVLNWAGGKSDRVLVSKDGAGLGDAQTTSDGRFVWIRTVGGAVTEWAAAEATTATHLSSQLLSASSPIVACARQGKVQIATPGGAGGSSLNATLFVPFPVSEVLVDGAAAPFTQVGSQLSIGVTTPVPPISTDDRLYHFNEGQIGDLVTTSGTLITPDGRLTSSGSWTSVRLKAGANLAPRPISIGMGVQFLPGAGGTEAAIHLESASGLSDVLKLRVVTAAGGATLALDSNGQTVASGSLPFDATGARVRFTMELNPATGTVTVRQPAGSWVFQGSVPAPSVQYYARIEVSNFVLVDDISFFDSAEDGQTPQGAIFWGLPSGQGGYAIHAPQLINLQDYEFLYNWQPIETQVAIAWYLGSGMMEAAATPYLLGTGLVPSSLRELIYHSSTTALLTTPGNTSAVSIVTAAGEPLIGAHSY